jgi:prevent-host-death family protein
VKKKINLTAARTQLSRLVKAASRGETIVITKYGKPVAKIEPFAPPKRRKFKFGLMKGEIWMADDFNDPLPDWLLDAFEGKSPD